MFKLPNFEEVLTLVDDVAGVFDTIPASIEDGPDFKEPDNYYLKVVEGFFAQQNDQTFGHHTSEEYLEYLPHLEMNIRSIFYCSGI